MHGLMFLFTVDIVVGYHLMKGGESRLREAPDSIHICPYVIRPKLDLEHYSGRNSLCCLDIMTNFMLHMHTYEIVLGVVFAIPV